MNNTQVARHHMIDGQLEPNRVIREDVIAAMGITPRERFVPVAYRQCAYLDEDIPLGHGRYLMEPRAIAWLIQALDLTPGEKVLVVAGNTGYSAVILAQIGCKVIVVEEQRELADFSRQALAEMGLATIKIQTVALYKGSASDAPFDAILIDGAVELIPDNLVSQLRDGGRMALIEGHRGASRLIAGMGQAVLCRKINGQLTHEVLGNVSVPVIPSLTREQKFTW